MTATAIPTKQRPWWLTLVMGIAAIIDGGILLFGSLTAQARLYLLLIQLVGIWWLVDGIMNFVYMFTDHTGWGWKLVMGINVDRLLPTKEELEALIERVEALSREVDALVDQRQQAQ